MVSVRCSSCVKRRSRLAGSGAGSGLDSGTGNGRALDEPRAAREESVTVRRGRRCMVAEAESITVRET